MCHRIWIKVLAWSQIVPRKYVSMTSVVKYQYWVYKIRYMFAKRWQGLKKVLIFFELHNPSLVIFVGLLLLHSEKHKKKYLNKVIFWKNKVNFVYSISDIRNRSHFSAVPLSLTSSSFDLQSLLLLPIPQRLEGHF